MRRRTAFAAPLVLTLACKSGPADPLGAQYSVQKSDDGRCLALAVVDCPRNAHCNPPGPRPIACPPKLPARIAILPDDTCAIVPADCDARSCATQKTPCPDPYK